VRRAEPRSSRRRPKAWAWLVTASACLLGALAIAVAVGWATSSERRIATYAVRGALNGITLDLGDGSAVVVGAGERPAVEVRRTDRFAFGHGAQARRDVAGGVLRIRSRCPPAVLDSCSASYRLSVPDNVPVTVRTTSGDVRFRGFHGSARIDTTTGDIAVAGYCGFALRARAETGDVRAITACPLERLELRSRTGDVQAVVPPGRYRVDAETDDGRRQVRGVTAADDAPFQIQALSSVGDVDVETGA
jgi:hypothetical protein